MLLGDLTTDDAHALAGAVILQPVGSVEPHGPHLPLSTDSTISEAASGRALALLERRSIRALIAPTIPYGVTDFAAGFAGAVSLPASVLTSFLRALVAAHLASGASHVCLVNNHLEPAQDAAVRAAIADLPAGDASVACPLTRRWARTLSAEFKSGACHAGQYETSLLLAARSALVRADAAKTLPPVPVSLSEGIRAGKSTFREMGMDHAYSGAPAAATAEEGEALLDLLAEMIATEVVEALEKKVERGAAT